jgi:hypothetical protein
MGVSNKGEVFYTVNWGANKAETIILFIFKLVQELDLIDPNWRTSTVFLFDNASYHKSGPITNILAVL